MGEVIKTKKTFEEMVNEIDNMVPFMKVRAYGALEYLGEEQKKLKPIYDDFEKSRDRIINIININDEYQIVEYETKLNNKKKEIYFEVFINFKRTCHSAYTLDEAIILALCIKYEGNNTQAPNYIAKMLGIPNKE